MAFQKDAVRFFLFAVALVGADSLAPSAAGAATFTIINTDSAGVGFNDTTPATPVGGNTGTTIGQQRLIAFQYAANIWGALVASNVTIQVSASFAPLTCSSTSAILGSAGPYTTFRDFSGAPVAATWYAVALANALHGSDLDAANPDITAQFNGAIGTTCAFPNTWYYGLDGKPLGNQIDFISVLIHELGHGLGFLTLVDLASGAKALGFNDAFMLNLENHGASPPDYPSMTNAQRVTASTATGNLHWVGAHVQSWSGLLTAGTVGTHVRISHQIRSSPDLPSPIGTRCSRPTRSWSRSTPSRSIIRSWSSRCSGISAGRFCKRRTTSTAMERAISRGGMAAAT